MSGALRVWQEEPFDLPTTEMDGEPRGLLDQVCVTLRNAQRAYAEMKADLKETQQELRLLHQRHQALLTHAEIEPSRGKKAEQRARSLKEQLERLQKNQLNSEIAALEASESARRDAESDAANYKDLYLNATAACRYAQRVAENQERTIVAIEERRPGKPGGGFSSLQYRLEHARKGKEMDKEQSIVIQLAMEGLLAREGGVVSDAFQTPSGSVLQYRREVEPGAMPQVLSIEDGRASAGRASEERPRFKPPRLLRAQLLEARLEGIIKRRCKTLRRIES